MKKNSFSKMMMTAALATLLAAACKKEKDAVPDINSPAFKIEESEKLVIPAEIDLPANLPGGNTRVATYYAEGVQKYKARVKAGSNPVAYEWVFTAPKADLFDAGNAKAGTHGAGPFWEFSRPQTGIGDSIFAQHFTPVKSSTPDINSIPWLLLMPKTGKTPTGIFANVSYIQRVATTGGNAPSAAPVSLSDTADVFYTAIYRFTKKN